MESFAGIAPMLMSMIDDEQIGIMADAVGNMLEEKGIQNVSFSYGTEGAEGTETYTPQEAVKMILLEVFDEVKNDGPGGTNESNFDGIRSDDDSEVYTESPISEDE